MLDKKAECNGIAESEVNAKTLSTKSRVCLAQWEQALNAYHAMAKAYPAIEIDSNLLNQAENVQAARLYATLPWNSNDDIVGK